MEKINFIQDQYNNNIPSNLDLVFNNQELKYVEVCGAKSISISNTPNLVDVELLYINDSIDLHNCVFNYNNSYYDKTLFIGETDLFIFPYCC